LGGILIPIENELHLMIDLVKKQVEK